ncbi:MAG TPA: PAS domain S-box protein [Candidatus Dormibacteraeota bacterium]|nr:PAS domain S-box protein [Candidatus Dormibacteraeota bacterium]
MRNGSTGVKLGIAFGFLIALLIGVGWLGLSEMGLMNAGLTRLYRQQQGRLQETRQGGSYFTSNYRTVMHVFFMEPRSKGEISRDLAQMSENDKREIRSLKLIESGSESNAEKELLEKITQIKPQFSKSFQKMLHLMTDQGKPGEASKMMANQTLPLLNRYRAYWNALVVFEEGRLNQEKAQSDASYETARQISSLLVLLAIGLAVCIAIFATRSLMREVKGRERAQIALRRLNAHLEKKVAARTVELARTVETLKEEVSNRRSRETDLGRLVAIVESSDDAIVAITPDGTVTAWNPGAVRMFGYREDEIIGKSINSIIPNEYRAELVKNVLRLLDGDTVTHHESVRVRKDGNLIHVGLTVSPLKGPDGKIVGTSAILRDITERKSIEDALRHSEAAFRSIIENAPYGVVRTTLGGEIVMANPAVVRMLGYDTEAEVLSLNMKTDVYRDPDERQAATSWINNQDCVHGIEIDWKRKGGDTFPVRCSAHLVRNAEANVDIIEGFIEDITETRALELQLRQGQKMEAIGRLAGGIAHDFNNLLGVIVGYAELVSEQAGQNRALLNPVDQIQKAASKASALTRQLLAFSRQQVLEMELLNLNTVVSEMAKMLPRLLGDDIELETSLDPGLGQVKADQGQIEQVIMNMAVNARDAMPSGGRLQIKTGNFQCDYESKLQHATMAPGQYVTLSVTDTGVGMDERTQAHIFEPFFTTKEQGRGTGLGLATTYGFVKQSGGCILVHSEPDLGSTFTVYLPLVHGHVIPRAPNDDVTVTGGGAETILLVEDEESLRTLARNLLLDNGYTVLEASNGLEAIETARKHIGPIHLLLTDMVMPGMSGESVAKKLTVVRPEIRTVYMSGYMGGSANGRDDFDAIVIPKPFTRDFLLGKLRTVLDFEDKIESV